MDPQRRIAWGTSDWNGSDRCGEPAQLSVTLARMRIVTFTAFIDESQRSGKYHLCAVLVPTQLMGALRHQTLLIGRGKLLHMSDADPRLKPGFVTKVAALQLPALLATTHGGDRRARDVVLRCLAMELPRREVTRMVIESCNQDRDDRRVLQQALGSNPTLTYACEPKGDALLGLPDVIAWAFPQSGRHRELLGSSVTVLRPRP